MKRYQIHEITPQSNHAGSKATADIFEICNALGFMEKNVIIQSHGKGFFMKVMRQISYIKDWKCVYNSIMDNSIVVLQHPFHYPQINRERILKKLKEKKKVKFISVVHDVQNLRSKKSNFYYDKEFQTMLDIADVLIVHNAKMYEYFHDIGIDSERLVILHIFDYLIRDYNYLPPKFSKKILIAGNLDVQKCKYLKDINKINVNFELYGPNYDDTININNNIHYNGSFSPDELPSILKCGFGLVWDGTSINTCDGPCGQYLRYNNPHKLSLYLASGLPVLIWDEAAEAKFVKENNVGILIHSLKDVEDIFAKLNEEEYEEMVANVKSISKKLQKGEYFREALSEALLKLGCE